MNRGKCNRGWMLPQGDILSSKVADPSVHVPIRKNSEGPEILIVCWSREARCAGDQRYFRDPGEQVPIARSLSLNKLAA